MQVSNMSNIRIAKTRLILTSLVIGSVVLAGASQSPISGSQLEHFRSCVTETRVHTSYPSNETWWYDSQSVFVEHLRHPIAVAYAERTSQVQELVKCATKYKLKMSIRSGGHSTEGFCNRNDTVVVDVSRINFVNIDVDGPTATVGAGIRIGRLYYELNKQRMTFPAGNCTTVGMGGLVASGGLGFLTRLLGSAADNVLELRMVDYRGEVLVASNETNDDLFFALRGGGGGNYGIVTEMKVRIYPNPPLSTGFRIRWNQPIAASDFSRLLFKWKPWTSMPRQMTIMWTYEKASSFLMGLYIGDDGHVAVHKILNESGLLELGPVGSQKYSYHSSTNLLEVRAWMDNNGTLYGNHSDYYLYNTPSSFIFRKLNLPPFPVPVHETWAQIQKDPRVNATHSENCLGSRGPMLNLEPLKIEHDYLKYTMQIIVKEFDRAAFEALDEYVSNPGAILEIQPLGGIFDTIADDFNAFTHRKELFMIVYFIPYYLPGSGRNPSGVNGQIEMARKTLTAMESYTNNRTYIGAPDLIYTTNPKVYMRRYYGNNVERLVRAKATYDPRDIFSFAQSTPTSWNSDPEHINAN